MKIAFLIVDMQTAFLRDRLEKRDVEAACEYINHVSRIMRSNGHVVVHVQDMEGADGDPDPEVRQIIPDIAVEPTDIRVLKEFSNAFWKTDLEQILRDQHVEFVVIAGFAAEHCVTFTLNGAQERDFRAAILQHGVLSTKADAITSMYRDRPVVSYQAIEFMAR